MEPKDLEVTPAIGRLIRVNRTVDSQRIDRPFPITITKQEGNAMTDDPLVNEVTGQLLQAHETRKAVPAPSKSGRELSLKQALEVQAAVADRLPEGGSKRICGYKVGRWAEFFTGRIQSHQVVLDGGSIDYSEMISPLVECEIGFVMGEALAGDDLTVTDVIRATDFVVPTFEIADHRFEQKPTANEVIADNGAFARMVVGGRPVALEDIDIRHIGVELRENGQVVEVGRSNRTSVNPAHAVLVVVRMLHEVGMALQPGDIVLSGSCTPPYAASAGTSMTATFHGMGSVDIAFA